MRPMGLALNRCPGKCALGIGLSNVPMCPGNGNPMCPGTIQCGTRKCALRMGLYWDLEMGLNQCALGMGLSNVPWEWD